MSELNDCCMFGLQRGMGLPVVARCTIRQGSFAVREKGGRDS